MLSRVERRPRISLQAVTVRHVKAANQSRKRPEMPLAIEMLAEKRDEKPKRGIEARNLAPHHCRSSLNDLQLTKLLLGLLAVIVILPEVADHVLDSLFELADGIAKIPVMRTAARDDVR